MRKPAIRRAAAGFTLPFAASTLLLSSAVLTTLAADRYPFASLEVAILILAVTALTGIMSWLYARSRAPLQQIYDALLVGIFVDLLVDGRAAAIVAGVVFYGASMFYNRPPHSLMAVFAILFVVSSAAIGGEHWIEEKRTEAQATDSRLPAIVHLILDEHVGLADIRAPRADNDTRNAIEERYRSAGFTTYRRAYSEHFDTVYSVPSMLEEYPANRRRSWRYKELGGYRIENSRYLDRIQSLEYSVRIYQSDYLGFCDAVNEDTCVTYAYGSLQPAAEAAGLGVGDRLQLLISRLSRTSHVLQSLLRILTTERLAGFARDIGIPLPVDITAPRIAFSLAALRFSERVEADLRQAKPGEAYLIHLLFPHYPYITEGDCSLRPVRDWMQREGDYSLAQRQAAYADQLRCVTELVMSMDEALSRSPAGGDYVFIVHGDHGSRLAEIDPRLQTENRFTGDDLIASYSTLFAVKVMGEPARTVETLHSVAAILKGLAAADFEAVPTDLPARAPTVFLSDETKDYLPAKRVSMPEAW